MKTSAVVIRLSCPACSKVPVQIQLISSEDFETRAFNKSFNLPYPCWLTPQLPP